MIGVGMEPVHCTPDHLEFLWRLMGELEVGDLNITRNLKDTLGVSVGGDWHVLPQLLTLRAGFMFEQGATPEEYTTTFQADGDKIAPTVGASVEIGETWRIDAAYSFVYQLPQDISNSRATQINPTFRDGATIIGNGSYSAFLNVFGLGMRAAF